MYGRIVSDIPQLPPPPQFAAVLKRIHRLCSRSILVYSMAIFIHGGRKDVGWQILKTIQHYCMPCKFHERWTYCYPKSNITRCLCDSTFSSCLFTVSLLKSDIVSIV